MPLTPGTTLGPYQIDAPLGAGGMGEVYKATDTRLDRTVAIKVLPEHVASDPDLKQRFEREARTVAALNHPHICTLHDIGSQDGVDFLVMEYLDGQTVAQRLEKGALPLDQALQIAIDIADALDKAHRQGIVHRDLKPGNIMLTKAGAKLLDFGLAKLRKPGTAGAVGFSAAATQSEPLTGRGTILGTLQYMAPEQLEGRDADARTDIFAFGAVVYEMVTGKKAFTGDSQASLIGAILKDEPRALSASQPLSPAALDRVIKKCLAKDPDARWQTSSDLHDELRWITQVDGQVGEFMTAVSATSSTFRKRALPLAFGMSLVAVVITGLAVWGLMGPGSPGPRPLVRFAINVPASDQLYYDVEGPSMALSADGQTLVYVATRNGVRQLYRRVLDQLEAVPIPGSEEARHPFFSPDGAWIGFAVGGALNKMPLAGGPPATVRNGDRDVTRASWGENDTIVFGHLGYGAEIWQVPAVGGVAEPATTRASDPTDTGHRWPEMLPGGTALLFTLWPASGVIGTPRIAVKSLETGERRMLVEGSFPHYARSGHIVFARENALWAVPFDADRLEVTGDAVRVLEGVDIGAGGFARFAVADNGSLVYLTGGGRSDGRRLVWVDQQGHEEPIGMTPRAYNQPQLSPDGRRVVVDTLGTDGDLFLYDLETQVEEQFTFDAAIDQWPIWSPDGSQIYFTSMRDGEPGQLYVKPADGSGNAERVLSNHISSVPSSWSADGEALVFGGAFSDTGTDILTVRLDGDAAPESLLATDANEAVPVISPNGRWIAYRSNETGEPRIYVRPFPDVTRGQRLVSDGPGGDPLWGPDGRELFYHGPEGVMAVPVETGDTFQRGTPTRLFSLDPYYLGANVNWHISSDGERFLMIKLGEAIDEPSQIILVQNWFDELRRLVPTP